MPPALIALSMRAMRVRLSLLAVIVSGVLGAAETQTFTQDLAIRYVNQDVITLGDVLERVSQKFHDRYLAGKPAPSVEERFAAVEPMLDELTDEQLLVQYGTELKVQLDRERIALNVLEHARRSGRGLTLRDQSRERERIERRETVRAVLNFFDERTAHIMPAELWQYYQAHEADFRRPARAHVYQLMFRPTSDGERRALHDAKVALFRHAQTPGLDAVIAGESTPRVDAFLAATDDASKDQQLDGLVAALMKLKGAALSRDGASLVDDALAIGEREARIRDPDQTAAQLETLRASLADQGLAGFTAAAKEHSEGPRADQGGDLGWIEPGSRPQAFEQQVFSLPAGGLSPVFWSEQVAYLVFVDQREEATQRSFSEVTAEIDTTLRTRRTEEVKRSTVAMLRAQATIRDLVSLRSLLLTNGG